MNWDKASQELAKDLDRKRDGEDIVKTRVGGGGTRLSYIEGWRAIAEANRIFGFDGWDRETVEIRQVSDKPVAYFAKVRVTVDTRVVREGCGYGNGFGNDAHELAIKEAETDATKRALMTFGWPFGLALYDKTQEHVSDGNGHAEDRSAYDVAPIPTTGISPKDFASVKGDPSSAQSGKSYLMLEPAMKANKTASALTAWWKDNQDEIKSMHTNGRWEFFEQMIEYGLSLCPKSLTVDLFWSNHLSALNILKKANREKFECLEEMMVTRVAWLADPEATVEFGNTINAG